MSAVGAFVILAALALAVLVAWLFTIAPMLTTIMCVVVVVLVLASALRSARRPSPFGGYAREVRDFCPHCRRIIEQDDAVRSVAGHLPMHERCARERQAVQS